jgi:hypothetical protein
VPQENKIQLNFFACPAGKYHSAYFPYALNKLNLAGTTGIKFKILSFYPG